MDDTAIKESVDAFFRDFDARGGLLAAFERARDFHRKDLNDMQWAAAQSQGPPAFLLGDVVEFEAGGFGVIDKVSEPRGGWPASYSVAPIEGLPFHPKSIVAWHYEGDFATRRGTLRDLVA